MNDVNILTYMHKPINHGMATAFWSYRVTLKSDHSLTLMNDVNILTYMHEPINHGMATAFW